jgi:hypothetical protein
MIDHQIGKLGAIDQHNSLFDPVNILKCVLRKPGRRYENTFSRPKTFQTTRKGLNCRPANTIRPPFCLDINNIKPQLVFFDDAINSAIA